MSESIEQQLIELSQFKTLISQILEETGNTAPDTGFRQWYNAIKTAILSSTRGIVVLANAECKKVPVNKVSVDAKPFFDGVTATVTHEKVTS